MGIRHFPSGPRAYIDLDGTCADFEKAARARGLDPAHFKLVAGAYLGLELIAGAAEAIFELDRAGILTFILTKPPSANPYAATEKILWTRQNLPIIRDRIIITPDKGAVGTPRDFLVDDRPDWANAANFPGTVIRFENNWPDIAKRIIAEAAAATKHKHSAASPDCAK